MSWCRNRKAIKFASGHTAQFAIMVGRSFSCALSTVQTLFASRPAGLYDAAPLDEGHECWSRPRLEHGGDELWRALHGLQRREEQDGGHRREQQLVHQQLGDHRAAAGGPLGKDVRLQKLPPPPQQPTRLVIRTGRSNCSLWHVCCSATRQKTRPVHDLLMVLMNHSIES